MKKISELLVDFRRFQLLYVALRLNIPQTFASGPKSLSEVSSASGLHEQRLLRILRGLLWAEILVSSGEDRFCLSRDYECLASSSPTLLADDILFHGRFFYLAWAYLEDYVKEGSIPFERAHGIRLFDSLIADSALAREFNRPMATRTLEYVDQVASLGVFDGAATVVDIGSGEGQLLLGIASRRVECTGIIFDLEIQKESALRAIADASLGGRCRFEAGDMFAAVPKAGDVYLLKWILHDWDDASVVHILSVLRRDIPRGARIVIIERLMPEPVGESVSLAQADLNMLVLNGGAERSLSEYKRLLRAGGFALRATEKIESRYGFYALIAEVENVVPIKNSFRFEVRQE